MSELLRTWNLEDLAIDLLFRMRSWKLRLGLWFGCLRVIESGIC